MVVDKDTLYELFGGDGRVVEAFDSKSVLPIDRGFDPRPDRLLNRGAVACVCGSYPAAPGPEIVSSKLSARKKLSIIRVQGFHCTDQGVRQVYLAIEQLLIRARQLAR